MSRTEHAKSSSPSRTGNRSAERENRRDEKAEDVEERQRLPTPVIYEIVRREGEEEMKRPLTSLWWSGIAAGLSMSFSLLAQGVLLSHLPDTPWRPLITSFGYTFGFLIVVLGRQQLFTENTITVVLPVIADFTAKNVKSLGRMWAVVFLANMVGTFIAALFLSHAPLISPDVLDAMLTLSHHMLSNDFWTMLSKGIGAGFLIAAMVWIIPSAEGAKFHVILAITYLVAIAEFGHIVVGSVEAFLSILNGQAGLLECFTGFTIPVLAGNIIGGTLLVSVISYAQVKDEM